MNLTLAFDVYGTLIDTSGVFDSLQQIVGKKASAFMELWRSKQLEYSFRRAAMDRYTDFKVCTQQALDYCCLQFDVPLKKEQRQQLMSMYTILPAFADVVPCLKVLKKVDYRIFAFSNGSAEAVTTLLQNAAILTFFDDVVSVEDVRMFKPSPKVYAHFNTSTNSEKGTSWLISGNSFDVMGAIAYGMQAAWVQRNGKTIYDPWEISPTLTVQSLLDLPVALEARTTRN